MKRNMSDAEKAYWADFNPKGEMYQQMLKQSNDPNFTWYRPCGSCGHDLNTGEIFSDYKPFGWASQIEELLVNASLSEQAKTRNQIICRIVQGIPGITCPQEINGTVAQAQAKIESLIMRNDFSPLIAPEIWAIIQSMKEQE